MKRYRKTNINLDMKFWDEIFGEKQSWRDAAYTFLKDYPKFFNKKSILDMGCGLGDGIVKLAKMFPKAKGFYGMDFYRPAIEKAEKNHPEHTWEIFDANEEDLMPEERFDTILLIQTLEHLEDPEAVVNGLLHNCRHLIVTVPKGVKGAKNHKSHIWYFTKKSFDHYQQLVLKGEIGDNRLLFIFQGDLRYWPGEL